MSQSPPSLTTPPPHVPNVLISFPLPHILLITLNRPKQLNAIPAAQHAALDALYHWYDAEPSLRCAVLTGTGRAFCAGADLKEWLALYSKQHDAPTQNGNSSPPIRQDTNGFGGLSNREGKKPVVAAVNGICLGGGMEMVINCDLVVAAADATFGLPEVTRGVVALAGALPRLARSLGRQRAAEMALLGRTAYPAEQMRQWGLVNFVVPRGGDVVTEALRIAAELAGNSPDAVVVSREGLRMGWEGVGPRVGTDMLERGMYGRINGGGNMREGLQSFVERRKAVWTDSKL